jgi:hypothetical protein
MAEEQPQTPPAENPPEESGAPDKHVPQETVNKLIGNTRQETREATVRDILQKFGTDSIEPVLEIWQDAKRFEEETKSREEKLEEQLKALQSEREQALQSANQRVITSELRSALTNAGINPERMGAAARIADTSSLEVADDGTVKGLEDAVKGVKETSPEWFGERQKRSAPDASVRQNDGTPQDDAARFLSGLLQG